MMGIVLCNVSFQCQNIFSDEQLWISRFSCAKQNFYGCLLPNLWTCQHETSSDHKTLRSLYTAYQTVCAVDNYFQSCMGADVDFSNWLHSGTSDCVVSESDDRGLLGKQSSWLGEMTGLLEEMAVSAIKRWQDAMSLSSESATDVAKVPLDTEHFDKCVLLYCLHSLFTHFIS